MKHGLIAATVSVAVATGLLLASSAGGAERTPARAGGGDRALERSSRPSRAPSRGFRPHHVHHHRGHHHHGHHHRFRDHGVPAFAPFAGIASPVVVYAPPLAAYGEPAYADPPRPAPPPVGYGSDPRLTTMMALAPAPEPPPPPMVRVVEYPTGRYELRGDGMTVPYVWVWIPNPPPGPPAEVPAVSLPSTPMEPPAVRSPQLYHWTDEQGVEHWTDRGDAVPDAYRPRGRRADPS